MVSPVGLSAVDPTLATHSTLNWRGRWGQPVGWHFGKSSLPGFSFYEVLGHLPIWVWLLLSCPLAIIGQEILTLPSRAANILGREGKTLSLGLNSYSFQFHPPIPQFPPPLPQGKPKPLSCLQGTYVNNHHCLGEHMHLASHPPPQYKI